MILGFLLAILKTVVSICFVLVSIALIHEFGHYATAKLTGIWVIEFAIGFGNRILKFRIGETLYSLRPLPLGGFVRLAGMDPPEEEESKDVPGEAKDGTADDAAPEIIDPDDVMPTLDPGDPRGYPSKPIWAKVLVLAAGSLMNLFYAVLLFIFIYVYSGGPMSNIAVLGVTKDQPAAHAGIRPGDVISAVAGISLEEWTDGIKLIQAHAGKEILLDVIRDHPIPKPGFGGGVLQGDVSVDRGSYLLYKRETLKIPVTPTGSAGAGRIGIALAPNTFDFRALPISRAVGKAFESAWSIIMQTVQGLARMISGETQADVAGPVKIMQMIKEQAYKGLADLLYLTAVLSVNIGLINLFPFPVLDGGRIVFVLLDLLFMGINFITGLKLQITQKVEENVHFVGMICLLLLLVFVTFQDIKSLFHP
ncbi:MAG: site-2 protease family protein [Candidatus Riflebacteria bacterium]|nr:site-2 protease family protein [Candidatus Riflebacteria bacterium]